MISDERAAELFKKYRETGELKVRNELVEGYMYVAEILAKKFVGRGVDYDDLLQVASEALIVGVEKFNPDFGNKFTTYITPTITGMLRNYFRDYSRSVRLPRKIYAISSKVKAAVDEYYALHGSKPTVKQLSAVLNEPEEAIIEAMEHRAPVSLDASVDREDGESPLYDLVADDEKSFEKFEDSESLRTEISKLDETERNIVKLRFVQGKSQSEAGRELGVSQMFVSRIERKIVEKLKEALLK